MESVKTHAVCLVFVVVMQSVKHLIILLFVVVQLVQKAIQMFYVQKRHLNASVITNVSSVKSVRILSVLLDVVKITIVRKIEHAFTVLVRIHASYPRVVD